MQKKKVLLYESLMSLFALIAVIIAIIDLTNGISSILAIIDNIILFIFIIDYSVRLILSKDKKKFIKINILDLLAIVPFNSLFKIFRIAKLARFARITKMSRIMKLSQLLVYILRFSERIKIFMNTNGFKYSLLTTVILISLGALGIRQFEKMDFTDAIWWAFVTTTTVGYGDISPSSEPGRLIAVILMITGIGLIGSLTSTITTYFFIKNQKRSPKDEVIHTIQKQIENIEDLSNKDIDEIYSLLKALNHKSDLPVNPPPN
jgi:voltage-gated potassium channel